MSIITDYINTETGNTHFNAKLAGGWSSEEFRHLDKIYSERLASIFNSNPNSPVKFIGLKMLTPERMALKHVGSSNSEYEFHVSNFIDYEIELRYKNRANETKNSKYPILLPFDTNGFIKISDNENRYLKPVLTDKIISPGLNSIFIRAIKTKIKVDSSIKTSMTELQVKDINNPDAADLIHNIKTSYICRPYLYSTQRKRTIAYDDGKTTLLLAIIAKYGLHKGLDLILQGYGVKHTKSKPLIKFVRPDDDFTDTWAPKKERMFATAVNPMKDKRTGMKIIVPKTDDQTMSQIYEKIAMGLIYIFNFSPKDDERSLESEATRWRLYAMTVLGSNTLQDDVVNVIRKHMGVKENDIDSLIKESLRREFRDTLNVNIERDGLYAIFINIFRNFERYVMNSPEIISSPVDKEFRQVSFILEGLVTAMNKAYMGFINIYDKEDGYVKPGKMEKIFTRHMKPKKIFSIRNDILPVDYVGDNLAFKCYNTADLQVNIKTTSNAQKRGGKPQVVSKEDPTNLLNPLQCLVNNIASITKSRLSPSSTVNMYATFTDEQTPLITAEDYEGIAELTEVYLIRRGKPYFEGKSLLDSVPEFEVRVN